MIIVFSKCIAYNKLKAFKDIMLFRKKGVYLGAKDITEKILADYNDVFADIANVLLFQGEQMISPDSLKMKEPSPNISRVTTGFTSRKETY